MNIRNLLDILHTFIRRLALRLQGTSEPAVLKWEDHFEKVPRQEMLDWIEEEGIETMEDAWRLFHHADWLIWTLEYRNDYKFTDKKKIELGIRIIREMPVGDGRTVFDLLTDPVSIEAVAVAERYIAGEASNMKVAKAVREARSARGKAEEAVSYALTGSIFPAAQQARKAAALGTRRAMKYKPYGIYTELYQHAHKHQADIIRNWWGECIS